MTISLPLEDETATERLAAALAPHLRGGDSLGLSGPLGAGKSHLARAIILTRLARLGRVEDVPSPTYTLVQAYDLGEVDLWHADLYRLGSPDELTELGLDQAFASAITLIEWPERLGELAPPRRLDIALHFVPGRDEARRAELAAHGSGWDWLALALAETAPAR